MKNKTFWVLVIFILCGLVIGGLIGDLASKVSWLSWLSYGQNFGMSAPLELDLNIIKITFAISIKINIASIIGMTIAIFIYHKAWK